MGYSLGWVAVQSGNADAIYARLGLSRTGAREEVPDSPVVGAVLPEGWHLVVVRRGEHLLGDALLREVSAGTRAVACFLEEHVMYSASVEWADGRKIWSVVHDSEKACGHLAFDGTPPSELSAIRSRLQSAQDEEDDVDPEVDHLFDIPIDLAKALTGFRHDERLSGVGRQPFEVLAAHGGATRPWWKRALGQ